MSRVTRVRILSQPLLATLTRAQAVMTCDTTTLYAAADTIATGGTLTAAETRTLTAAQTVLGGSPLQVPTLMSAQDRTLLADTVAAIADAAVTEQRDLIAATVCNTLQADGWTVTSVEGRDASRYTGIEATRDTEHLVAAVGPAELIADQSGARDCTATMNGITDSLRDVGWTAAVVDDVPHDGSGGSLYALSGGPTKAHAIEATMRHEAARPPARHAAPDRSARRPHHGRLRHGEQAHAGFQHQPRG